MLFVTQSSKQKRYLFSFQSETTGNNIFLNQPNDLLKFTETILSNN